MTVDQIMARTWDENILFSVLFELTYTCNLNCFYCYNDLGSRGEPLTLDEYEGVLRELAKMQKIFVLDEVGEFVWEHFDGRCELAAVVREVTEQFDVSTEQAEIDIAEFATALLEAGLVVEGQPEPGSESNEP